jgi:Cu(I)/Ag(I) efflux system membrane fusion protein
MSAPTSNPIPAIPIRLASPPASPAPRRFGPTALVAVAIVSAAVAATAVVAFSHSAGSGAGGAVHEAAEVEMYQCPMHPSIVQDHPGKCPICGMTLVKIQKGNGETSPGAKATTVAAVPEAERIAGLAPVVIDPDRQQLIGLTTAEVTRGPVGGAWRSVGRVSIDETRVRHINLKVPGFVERIYVDFIGKNVRKGDPLFSIYSPELLSAQEEYLLALRTSRGLSSSGSAANADGEALVSAARRKLALWDVPEAEIARMARTGQPTKTLTLRSPLSGVVTKKDVVEGMKLDAGAMPYEIVDLSSVWVLVDVYENELRFVKPGMAGTLRLNALPDREFKGRVVFMDPLLDPRTRTVKARLTFANPTGELRPEMFGEVVLHGEPHVALRIPQDAIIDSGTEKIVFVASGAGKFEPRKVKVGASDGSQIEIVAGLDTGLRVVTRANFLVDSESRLRASLAEMSHPLATPARARVLPATSDPVDLPASGPAP